MIDLETIEQRIRDYQIELSVLRTTHDQMVAVQEQSTKQFNERVQQNQVRFQQLTGIISELEKMQTELQTENNGELTLTDRLKK